MKEITGLNLYLPEFSNSTSRLLDLKQKIDVQASQKNENSTFSEDLKKACAEFESFFVNQILKEMRSSIPKNELWDGGQAEEIYKSMLDEKLAMEISVNGGLGLAKQLYEALSKNPDSSVSLSTRG